jgi:sulfotransferase family protein
VPLFEQRVMVMVRSVRAFLTLQAGITRSGEAPPPSWLAQASQNGELEAARRELESKDQELRELRSRPAENGAGTEASRQAGSPGLAGVATDGSGAQKPVRTEQLIWMFGHSRTGSTWLSWMMAELENQERWHEPYVGMLFGSFIYQKLKDNRMVLNSPTFIMAEPYREVWLRSIRNFILDGAAARFPELREDQYLVIKEPNGSIGAPLLMEATPGSRMIFLIRDPRDVIASRLEAFGKSGWAHQKRDYSTAEKLNEHTEQLAEDYLRVVSKVQGAYEAHPGKKALVRYENLRHDTAEVLKAMYDALEIEVDEAQIEAAVTKHSWEQIPESEKGKDKFFRKAQPGGWRDDLSPEQIKLIEDITRPILSKYY